MIFIALQINKIFYRKNNVLSFVLRLYDESLRFERKRVITILKEYYGVSSWIKGKIALRCFIIRSLPVFMAGHCENSHSILILSKNKRKSIRKRAVVFRGIETSFVTKERTYSIGQRTLIKKI